MKRGLINGIFSVMVLSLFAVSCHKSKKLTPPDIGYAYFPMKIGNWIVYDVDSTYFVASIAQNIKYQIKESVESVFLDNSGRPEYRIERFYRLHNDTIAYDQLPWEISNVWIASTSASTAERVEEDQRYLKLVFPVVAGKKWNGNAFNAQDAWDYEYASVNNPLTKVFAFDSTLTVSQNGLNDPVINTQLGSEIYAKNVGMVYKYYKSMKMLPDTSGSEYTMTINDYSR